MAKRSSGQRRWPNWKKICPRINPSRLKVRRKVLPKYAEMLQSVKLGRVEEARWRRSVVGDEVAKTSRRNRIRDQGRMAEDGLCAYDEVRTVVCRFEHLEYCRRVGKCVSKQRMESYHLLFRFSLHDERHQFVSPMAMRDMVQKFSSGSGTILHLLENPGRFMTHGC
jgi:hypothetical protein